MSPQVLDTIRAALQFLLTTLFLGVGVWALKAYIANRTTLPRAKEGFLTLEDLKVHCGGVQEVCLGNISQQMSALATVVDQRLGQGDKLFAEHTTRLREIEKDLVKTTEALKGFEKGFCEKVVSVMRKVQKEEDQK